MPPYAPSIDELEQAVIDRLKLIAEEITGVNRSFPAPPSFDPSIESFPYCWVMLGATPTPSNGTAPGLITVTRQFVQRLLVAPLENGVIEPELGSDEYTRAIPFAGRFIVGYTARPTLQTLTLPGLRGVEFHNILDSGIVSRPSPANAPCVAYDFTITVKLTRRVDVIPEPPEV